MQAQCYIVIIYTTAMNYQPTSNRLQETEQIDQYISLPVVTNLSSQCCTTTDANVNLQEIWNDPSKIITAHVHTCVYILTQVTCLPLAVYIICNYPHTYIHTRSRKYTVQTTLTYRPHLLLLQASLTSQCSTIMATCDQHSHVKATLHDIKAPSLLSFTHKPMLCMATCNQHSHV